MPEIDSYNWVPGASIRVPVQVVVDEIARVRTIHGRITPALLVDESADPARPLHGQFEWDNAVAARAHRENQAAHIIRSVVVVYKKPEGALTAPVRAFPKIQPRPEDVDLASVDKIALEPHVYTPMSEVMSDGALRRIRLLQALRAAMRWRQAYRDLAELAPLFDTVDKFAEEVQARLAAATTAQAS